MRRAAHAPAQNFTAHRRIQMSIYKVTFFPRTGFFQISTHIPFVGICSHPLAPGLYTKEEIGDVITGILNFNLKS